MIADIVMGCLDFEVSAIRDLKMTQVQANSPLRHAFKEAVREIYNARKQGDKGREEAARDVLSARVRAYKTEADWAGGRVTVDGEMDPTNIEMGGGD